jgi:hypothetical protein
VILVASEIDQGLLHVFFIEVPQHLQELLWPWIEEEQAAYRARVADDRQRMVDQPTKNFLDTLLWFRTVVFQDAAVLAATLYPDAPLFQVYPFNTEAFQVFKTDFMLQLKMVEDGSKKSLMVMPDAIATAVHAAITLATSRFDQQLRLIREDFQDLLQTVNQTVAGALGSDRSHQGRKRRRCSASTTPETREPSITGGLTLITQGANSADCETNSMFYIAIDCF